VGPNQGLQVFKPRSDALERIVNYANENAQDAGER
jgi:hypothetical protein